MHSQNCYIYLFTKVSVFETTGYRKLELNIWGPHSDCVEVSFLPGRTAVPFGAWFSTFRIIVMLLMTATPFKTVHDFPLYLKFRNVLSTVGELLSG